MPQRVRDALGPVGAAALPSTAKAILPLLGFIKFIKSKSEWVKCQLLRRLGVMGRGSLKLAVFGEAGGSI